MSTNGMPQHRGVRIALGCLIAWQVSAVMLCGVYALSCGMAAKPAAGCTEAVPATVTDNTPSLEANGRHIYKLQIQADNGDEVTIFRPLSDGLDRAEFKTAELSNPGFLENAQVTLYRWHGDYIKLGTSTTASNPVTADLDNWSPMVLWLIVLAVLPLELLLFALAFRPNETADRQNKWRAIAVVSGIVAAMGAFVIVITGGLSVVTHMYSVFL